MLLRILNIILSVVMIMITTGFSVSKHFCHDRLVDTEVFAMAQSCSEISESCCEGKEISHCTGEMSQDDCCKNENLLVKFNEQFTVKQPHNPAKQQFSIYTFVLPEFRYDVISPEEKRDLFRIVQPPPLSCDLLLFVQSFLI